MKQGLQLKSAQQQALTPQLQRALKILQLSATDLQQEVAQELVDNPLLVSVEEADPASALEPTETTELTESAETVEPTELNSTATSDLASADWRDAGESQRSELYNSNESPLEQTIASHESLQEHMLWQIRLTSLTMRDQGIAEHLVYCLDEDGYLSSSVEEIAKLLPVDLDAEPDEINAVLSLIKTLEPRGVGARDLQERLQIMLAGLVENASQNERGIVNADAVNTAQLIVGNYFDLLAKRDFAQLKKKLKINDADLQQAMALITAQNPRIANRFFNDSKQHISADLLIQKVANTWVAKINPANQMRLGLNDDYTQLLENSDDPSSSEFLQQYLQTAKAFIKGLHSRYDTLLTVGNAIAVHQQSFFENGAEQLQALTLKTIADDIGVHESTVSRAVAGKYLLCKHGVLELKFFFPAALSNTSGDAASATAIRSLIKQMVAQEPSHKPLSDNKIAQQLESRGHIVARRTVAKYRESLQIAPSSQRKKLSAD